jgi:hypothetical protein
VSGHLDIRLLLADVDGTLVTQDKVLTEAAKEAARELHDAGIAFAITSGRPTWLLIWMIGRIHRGCDHRSRSPYAMLYRARTDRRVR